MTHSEEQLIAYADGELSGEELREVERALKAEPDMQAFVERQQALRLHLEEAFGLEDTPERLLDAVAHAPVSWRWRLRQALVTRQGRKAVLWPTLVSGAALACGILIGILVAPEGSFHVDGHSGAMMAKGSLATALDRQLASADGGPLRIGLSFRAKDGRYCRTFENDGRTAALAGVACHDEKGWAIAALTSAPSEGSAYHMAAAMPDVVRRTVADMIAGEPLDATQEREARDKGW
jgi:hypothetical protein